MGKKWDIKVGKSDQEESRGVVGEFVLNRIIREHPSKDLRMGLSEPSGIGARRSDPVVLSKETSVAAVGANMEPRGSGRQVRWKGWGRGRVMKGLPSLYSE